MTENTPDFGTANTPTLELTRSIKSRAKYISRRNGSRSLKVSHFFANVYRVAPQRRSMEFTAGGLPKVIEFR